MLPLMPKGSIDRLADVPIRWVVLGLLIAGIWIFVKSWTYRNDADRYVLRTEGETLRIAVGEELELTFQTRPSDPGEYESPPSISSSSLQFLDVTAFRPLPQAGLAQRFRFKGAIPGRAIVVFHHSGKSPVIRDTVNVH
jgi:hypothetical protein